MPIVEQELLTPPEHLSSHPVFSGVRVTRSLVLYACFVDRCLSFCTFFCHCVVCSSSIYGLWLPLWYLQTLLAHSLILMCFELLARWTLFVNVSISSKKQIKTENRHYHQIKIRYVFIAKNKNQYNFKSNTLTII